MPAKRFYELDLLRFIAAFSVLLFHYSFRGYAADNLSALPYLSLAPLSKYGFLGVNLFFLISGFVILMTASSGSKRHFVVSRIVRLYPAYWVCCTATFLVMRCAASARFVPSLRQYLLNMTMLNGFIGVPFIDSVYWSLQVEMKFYALVFLMLLFRQIHRAKALLGIWLALYLVAGLVHVKLLTALLIPEHAPYFIAGAIFFLISREGLSLYKGGVLAACYAVMLKQALPPLHDLGAHYHTTYSAVAVGAALAAFFAIFFLITSGRTEALATRRWQILGALTYPLYLIHQNIGFAIFNAAYPRYNAHLVLWGVVALMLGAAYAVNRVERLCAKPMKAFLLRRLAPRTEGQSWR
jgi:peptidoglycan/LPS O-acetylase OafA/YrhL